MITLLMMASARGGGSLEVKPIDGSNGLFLYRKHTATTDNRFIPLQRDLWPQRNDATHIIE